MRRNDLFTFNSDEANSGNVEGNKYWFDLDYLYYYREPFVDFETKMDVSMRFNDADYLMFSVKEAQVTHLGTDYEVSYGRVILDWVEIDRIWGLGKVNNRVNFDGFRPGQEGLIGLRQKFQISKWFMFDVFLSGFYLPELNPPLNIDKDRGSITSKSPWAQLPNQTVDINPDEAVENNKEIFYQVNEPSYSEVFFQDSIGLNLKFSPYETVHFTAFYLKKPENNLSNTATVALDDSRSDDSTYRPVVTVNPQIFDHEQYGGQVTAEFFQRDLKLYASYLSSEPGVKPDNLALVDLNIGIGLEIEKQPEEYFGTGFHWEYGSGNLGIGYLSRISDFRRSSPLTKVPRWSQAVHLTFNQNLYEGFDFSADIKYDTLTYDRLWMASLAWTPHPSFKFMTGIDMIGTPQNGDGFWVPFRQNDSVYLSAHLLF